MRLTYYPDPVLLRPAERILVVTEEIRAKALAMVPFMKLEGGVGLAAPQVGWGVSLLLASEDGEPENTKVLVNPRIASHGEDQVWGEEGCLSFPEIYGEVLRYKDVVVEATDLDGNPLSVVATDFFARVLQHEVDHLEGKLFIDRMRPADKEKNRLLLFEMERKYAKSTRAPESAR
ncbi:MAG TPA: peptide deformylase [Planctomycetota bacterium]|nr:peptide deformylase [Planctomycetota bacterium]